MSDVEKAAEDWAPVAHDDVQYNANRRLSLTQESDTGLTNTDRSDAPLLYRTSEDDPEAQQQLDEKTDPEHRTGPSSVSLSLPIDPTSGAEYHVSTSTKLTYLAVWFILNLTLTLYNKAVLGAFPYPLLLTAIHCTCVAIGCSIWLLFSGSPLRKLSSKSQIILTAFSVLFTANVAMSNISLKLVSVPFHQTIRSLCPLFTVLIYRLFFSRAYSNATYASLIPIIVGVALATYGDYSFDKLGFSLTIFGAILASVKSIMTNRILTGNLALPTLELLLRMSPLATIQSVIYAYFTGELSRFIGHVTHAGLSQMLILSVLGNGVLACVLNISSLSTNKAAGALTLTVAGNVKQCLTILLGIICFNVPVYLANGIGMLVTLIGGAIYSKVELDSRGKT
ncbi:MAG: UAA transporter [Chrysothrix sp. TS-e1954]|nr:MAG: UAA transporter [Chrysothrix sp. TS-e1954]